MKKLFTFTESTLKKRHWNNEFTASLAKKVLILLGIMLLPNISNAAIRRFEVTKSSYVYIDNGAAIADPGSLPAAVDSVNKYSTDSCMITFNLQENDTIKVTSYVAKEITNETYTLLDGGKNGAKIKTYYDYFSISGANHVVLKNLEFVKDNGSNALKIQLSVVDEITNCKFFDNSSTYGALNILSSTVTNINNCLFSKNKIGLSADAKSSVTVSDCQFTDNTVYGISGNGNKNLILRNCTFTGNTEGMRNFSGKAYNCAFNNNESASYLGSGDFYNCSFTQNSTAAIQGGAHVINRCHFTKNRTAINAIQSDVDSICYSYIGNNDIGINISQTQVKNIIGDTIVSNETHGILIQGPCTHIYDNVISNNRTGIEIGRTSIDSICGNTIISNRSSGVISSGRGVINVFSNNYIGTNSKFEALGNMEDGVQFSQSSAATPSEFKNNIIGNNRRYGINFEAPATKFTIESCYVGVAPDSTPIPNSISGIYIKNSRETVLKNSTIANNVSVGVKAEGFGTLTISDCSIYGNKDYGVQILSSAVANINNCLFLKNTNGLVTDTLSTITLTDCQFADNNKGILGYSSKNLILRNCTISGSNEGLLAFSGKAYDCVFKNNESASYLGLGDFYNCLFTQNSTAAIQGGAHVINRCRFTENATAINAIQSAVDSICYSYIGNNDIGINISQTQVKNIIGDTIVSNQKQGIRIQGQCTHIYDNLISGNETGIEIGRTTIDSICGNTIISNKTSGVISSDRGVLNVFSNNYIGTNSKFEALGNGEDGVSFSKSSSAIPTEFKNNIIGNNGRYGINLEASIPQLTIESCYVGVAPDSTPIPNAKGGLYINTNAHKTVLKNSTFAKNGGTGVKAVEYGELSLSGCFLYGNKGYGVYFASELTNYNFSVDNCVFNQNDSSAIYTSYPYAGEGSSYVSSSITNTLFLNTKKKLAVNKAIETNNPLPAPVITSVQEDENGYMVINGKVEFEGKTFVELYLCEDGEETTSKFMASDSTDAEGNFSIRAKRTALAVTIVATSSFSRETSTFSEPYTYFNGNRDDYYVKVNGEGDGLNWETAMSGKDFVKLLPMAPTGVTFHVAAGTYDLKELSGGNSYVDINNPVTIIGGYPADADTSATSSPLENTTLMKTGYFRLNTGGNVVFDGLKFDNENYRGAYDANSNGKYGLCVTLKNSIVEGNESNADAVYSAHGGKTILYNDIITGSYTYSAVFTRGDSLIINKCHISGAKAEGGVGTSGGYLNIDSTTITGNAVYGIYLTGNGERIITNSVISDNGGDGVSVLTGSITLKNNRIGVDAKGNAAGNRMGVILYSDVRNSIIEDNIIAGNDSTGIFINGVTNVIKGNYIGTDRNFNNIGNGSDGLFIGGRCVVTFPSSLDSANYIGFNKRHGIYSQGNMTACNASFNYIGVTPQGDPMPNGEYGIYMETSRQNQNIKGNLIGFNGKGGVHYEDINSIITENLFFGTNGKAISDHRANNYPLAIPSITQVKKDNGNILIEGTTDTFRVSTIELFYTNGEPQTAHEFLGNTVTDSTGAFSFAIPEEKLSEYGDTICFSATATYEMGKTSNLSDPFCCENCLCVIDTTVLPVDTILVGESFLGITYTEAGFYDDIFEVLKRPNGCDFVVKYSLVVLPNEGTGIENQLAGSKSIYPNPATNVLYVTNNATFSFMIQDMLGHTVMEGSSSNGSIDISDLPQGFYFLRLGDEGREGVFQFVKTQK